ncbi:MAG: acyl-CoA desaturase [Bacteroidota bacterium]
MPEIARLSFQKESDSFFQELRKEVHVYLEQQPNGRYANRKAVIKAIVLFSGFLASYLTILSATASWHLLLGYSCLGPIGIFLVLNTGHDASHSSFSTQKWVNKFLLLSFNLLGISGYMWRLRHVHSHHIMPNVPDWDVDISQSKIVRLSPRTVKWKIHAYQHIYMPFLYLLYTLNMFIFRDFKDFTDKQIGQLEVKEHPRKELMILVLTKVFFFGYLFLIPLWVTPFSWPTILVGFLLAEVMASLFLTFILVSAHVGEDSVYPEPNEHNLIEHSWARHQVMTTTDFSTASPLVTHLYGAFNHHTVHHLFPYVCHIHYPVLTHMMVRKLEEHQIPYNLNPKLTQAIWSHYKLLMKHSKIKEPMERIDL